MIDFLYRKLVLEVSAVSTTAISSAQKILCYPKCKRGRLTLTFGVRVGVGVQNSSRNKINWIAMMIMFAGPRTAFACAACTGRSDDAVAEGLNVAVLTLLLVLLAVYGAVISSLVYLIRRASKHPLTPPDMQKGAV